MSDETGLASRTTLSVPRGYNNLPPMVLEMSEIYRIEDRISEIRLANPMNIPSLISDFLSGYIQVTKHLAKVQLEKSEAEIALREAKSICILDKAEAVLAEKKQKSTADTREAVLHMDPQVQAISQRLNMLEAVFTLLRDKSRALEMAYHGAKHVSTVQSHIPDSRNYGGYSGQGQEAPAATVGKVGSYDPNRN